MTTALTYAIKYVSSMETPFASTATSLALTLGLSRRSGANSKRVALPLRCILPRRNTRLVPASWVSAFLTSRRSTRRKEVEALSSPRRPRLCTGSSSPGSKNRRRGVQSQWVARFRRWHRYLTSDSTRRARLARARVNRGVRHRFGAHRGNSIHRRLRVWRYPI